MFRRDFSRAFGLAVMVLPGIFGLVVQMTPRAYGEGKNLLLAALSSEYQHPKVAIAVDADDDRRPRARRCASP